MTAPTLTYPQLLKLDPCSDALREVKQRIGDETSWNGRNVTAAEAVERGVTFDQLMWVTARISRTDKDVERRLRLWLADCAIRVLPIYENKYPDDFRVRDCIIAARKYARGKISKQELQKARDAAYAAAYAAYAAYAAAYAAYAAADAAAAANTYAAANAAANAAAYAATRKLERQWQFDRLVARLSDPEPDDWPLPAKK